MYCRVDIHSPENSETVLTSFSVSSPLIGISTGDHISLDGLSISELSGHGSLTETLLVDRLVHTFKTMKSAAGACRAYNQVIAIYTSLPAEPIREEHGFVSSVSLQ